MATFHRTVILPASPGEAWEFVEKHGQEVEPLQFQPRSARAAGVLNDITGRVLGIPFRGVSRTLVWDPPATCVFESVKPAWPVRT